MKTHPEMTGHRIPVGFAIAILGCLAAQAGNDYPTSQRIQISESCPQVAKWLAQGLGAGTYWIMPSYSPELGTLTFAVNSSLGNLSKADLRRYVDAPGKAKNVRVNQVMFTLRSLVTSALSFEGAKPSSGESCTISAAIKFVAKDGKAAETNGKMEADLLKILKDRYVEHGLDY